MRFFKILLLISIFAGSLLAQGNACRELQNDATRVLSYEQAVALFTKINDNAQYQNCSNYEGILTTIAFVMNRNSKRTSDQESKAWKAVLKKNPNNPQALTQQANIYLTGNDTSNAILSFERAIAYSSTPDSLRIEVGWLYLAKRQWNKLDEALRTLEEAVERNQNSVKGHLLLGQIYKKNNRFFEAGQQFDLTLKLDPDNRSVFNRSARIAKDQLSKAANANQLVKDAEAAFKNRRYKEAHDYLSILSDKQTLDDFQKQMLRTCKDSLFAQYFLAGLRAQNAKHFNEAESAFAMARDQYSSDNRYRARADSALNVTIGVRTIYEKARAKRKLAEHDLENRLYERANINLIVSTELEPIFNQGTTMQRKEAFAGFSLSESQKALKAGNFHAAITYAGQAMEYSRFADSAKVLQDQAQKKYWLLNRKTFFELQLPALRENRELGGVIRTIDSLQTLYTMIKTQTFFIDTLSCSFA